MNDFTDLRARDRLVRLVRQRGRAEAVDVDDQEMVGLRQRVGDNALQARGGTDPGADGAASPRRIAKPASPPT